MIFASLLTFSQYIMLVLNVQQTTSADDIFRCVFAGASIVNRVVADQMSPNVALHIGHPCLIKYLILHFQLITGLKFYMHGDTASLRILSH